MFDTERWESLQWSVKIQRFWRQSPVSDFLIFFFENTHKMLLLQYVSYIPAGLNTENSFLIMVSVQSWGYAIGAKESKKNAIKICGTVEFLDSSVVLVYGTI